MSADFEIRGADDFYRLSKALKAAGRSGLRNELNAGMRRAGRPLVKVAKNAARNVFPKRGGLSDREAKIPFRAVTRTGRENHGVQIVAPGNWVAAKTTNASGSFRRPVFGEIRPPQTLAAMRKEWTWRDQEIPGATGWFDGAMEGAAPVVRPELEKAMENVIDQIVREAK